MVGTDKLILRNYLVETTSLVIVRLMVEHFQATGSRIQA